MKDTEKSKEQLIEELEGLRRRVRELEDNSQGSDQLSVSGIDMRWDPSRGLCTFEGLPVAMMWIDTTLAGLMSGVQSMVGARRFGLALQSEGRRSVEADWEVIEQFRDFREGFRAIANIAAVAGWGEWEIVSLDEVNREVRIRVHNSWEGRYQKALGVCWGSGMLAGKMAGYCSKLFDTNCWAEQVSFIAPGDDYDEFVVRPSPRLIEEEIEGLLATDEATRADMAVALRKLEKEIEERKRVEEELRRSRAQLHSTIESLPFEFFAMGSDGRYFLQNSRNKERWGDLVGKRPENIGINGEVLAKWQEGNRRAFSGETVKGEIEYARTGKREVFYSIVAPIRDEDEILGIVGVNIDVTDRKQAEEALRESEERYRSLFKDHRSVMLLIDPETADIVDANPAACSFYGYSLEELREKKITEINTLSEEQVFQEMQRAKSENRNQFYFRHRLKGGEVRDVEVYSGPITLHGKRLLYSIVHDITRKKMIEEALRFTQFAIDHSADGAFWVGSDARFTYVNEAACRTLGYTRDELLQMAVHDIDPDFPREGWGEHWEKTKKQHFTVLETFHQRKDGGKVPVEVSLNFVEFEGEEYHCAFARDITKRKRAEEALRESESTLRSIFRAAPTGIGMVINRVITRANDRLCEMLGYSRDELVGKSARIVYPSDEEYEYVGSEKYGQISERGTGTVETRWQRKDGEIIDVLLSSTPLDVSDISAGVTFTALDITDRKQAEAELRNYQEHLEDLVAERTEQLEAANREMEAFAYSVSHDLRAPLRAIDGFSQAILEDYQDRLDKEGVGYLTRVRTASQRMGRLIDDLLSLSRLSRQKMKREEVDLSSVARKIASELLEKEPGREVEFVIADGLTGRGDASLLGIALENLLGNAWKFTSGRSGAIIEFGACRKEGKTAYFVRDNGAGFDMAYQDKLFGAFQRLHGAEEFEGQGIGLATVQRIIHRHRGRVWAEGEVDRGATLYFTLKD